VAVSKHSPYVSKPEVLQGAMLANNTRYHDHFSHSSRIKSRFHSIRHWFSRCLAQYDKLMRRKAFLDQYERFDLFSNSMDEFADCRATVEALSDEYEACESAQYAVSTNV